MTEARPTEERDEALEIAKRYVPPALEEWVRGTPMKQVRDALAAEIRAYGERQTNAARQNWRSRMGLTASSDELLARAERAEAELAKEKAARFDVLATCERLEAELAAARDKADHERERANDHDSARQSEKERADYAESELAAARERVRKLEEALVKIDGLISGGITNSG